MWQMPVFYGMLAAGVIAGFWNIRQWALTWGATPDELAYKWPGDELSPKATEVATRAITIAAPADAVWSWIVQLGQDRAGFYSYTWLENLFRCVMPRVEQIVPAWQERTLGDNVWMARPDRYDGNARQKVVLLDPHRVLSLASPLDSGRILRREPSEGGNWTFILVRLDLLTTRLVIRSRGPASPSIIRRLFWMGVFQPAHFMMERRMMLRLKSLAETQNACPSHTASRRRDGNAEAVASRLPLRQHQATDRRSPR